MFSLSFVSFVFCVFFLWILNSTYHDRTCRDRTGFRKKPRGRSALFFSRLVLLYFVNSNNNNWMLWPGLWWITEWRWSWTKSITLVSSLFAQQPESGWGCFLCVRWQQATLWVALEYTQKSRRDGYEALLSYKVTIFLSFSLSWPGFVKPVQNNWA